MKHFSKRAVALALALAIGATPAAFASVALGDDLKSYTVPLSRDTNYTKALFWSNTYSDLRTENYLTYAPNPDVTPVVSYGDKILSRATLTSMAKDLESDGKRVVGGINGDYYVVATGAPLGMVVTGGVLRSSAAHFYAAGFLRDGTVFLGQPQLAMTITFSGHTLILSGINKVRTATGGYYLLTEDFSSSTRNSEPGVDVILTPVIEKIGETVPVRQEILRPDSDEPGDAVQPAADTRGISSSQEITPDLSADQSEPADIISGTLLRSANPTIGGRVTYEVEQVLSSSGSIPIPEGKVVLTINNKSNEWLVSELASLEPGATIDLDITTPDPRWAEADYAVGAMYKLVTDGVAEPGLDSTQAPRSAVGVRADGTAVFYTIDGRSSSHSVGASLTQVARRLIELGCTEAVCLDGGGSTTLGITPPSSGAMGVVNRPSEGYERSNSNAVFLLSNLTPTGVPSHLHLTPGDGMLLPGATLQLASSSVDTAWYPMAESGSPSWSVLGGGGSISPSGLFTAGDSAGSVTVEASADGVRGTAEITVVQKPDSIRLLNEAAGTPVTSLALDPGQTVDLRAVAVYRNITLTAQDTCFTWSAEGDAGTVDQNGLFTAAPKTGTGSLTVSAGGRSVIIPVSVTGHVLKVSDFEDGLSSFTATATADVALQTGANLVRYGLQSLRLDYRALGGAAAVSCSLALSPGEKYLNMWVYGDGSGNTLSAFVNTGTGPVSVPLTVLDFSGWRYVSAGLPAESRGLMSLTVTCAPGASTQGTLYVDQITSSNEPVNDLTPPVVTLSVANGLLRASITDDMTRAFDKAQIKVTRDGKPLSFTWDSSKGALSAALPAGDGAAHRLTVTAADLCGNIGRASYDQKPAPSGGCPDGEICPPSPFADTEGHWASEYALYLYDHEITVGIETPSGLEFQPQKNITRGEFFLMISRWMGLNLGDYDSVQLPFDDTAAIPGWALPGVKAMYKLGITTGSRDGAALNANAAAPITRAEAMVILGRVQPRGYAEPDLTFDDAALVPDWAVPFVKSLTGQGVVGGFENKISPSDPVKRGEVAKMLYTIL